MVREKGRGGDNKEKGVGKRKNKGRKIRGD